MKKLASFVAAACIVFSSVPASFAATSDDPDAAETVTAACERYRGPLYERCLGRAAQIVKRYPQIMRNLRKARGQSSSAKNGPSTAAERRAKRLEAAGR